MTLREHNFSFYNTTRYSNNQLGVVDPVALLSFQSMENEDIEEEIQIDNEDTTPQDSIDQQFYSQKFSRSSVHGGWKRPTQQKEAQSIGLFGSLITTGSPYYVTGSTFISNSLSKERQITTKQNNFNLNQPNFNDEMKGDEDKENDVTVTLLSSLSPMRDRYLTTVLNKMNDPVLQVYNHYFVFDSIGNNINLSIFLLY